MRPRALAMVIGALLFCSAVPAPAHAAVEPADSVTYRESFEQGMGGWQADTDGRAKAWKIDRITDQPQDGAFSLRYWVDGRGDDGTVWVERTYRARPNTTVAVSLSFWLYSPRQSPVNNWRVVGYAGATDPKAEQDFPAIGMTDRTTGWAKYTLNQRVTTDATGTVWVGAGISVLWEAIRAYEIDTIETTITS